MGIFYLRPLNLIEIGILQGIGNRLLRLDISYLLYNFQSHLIFLSEYSNAVFPAFSCQDIAFLFACSISSSAYTVSPFKMHKILVTNYFSLEGVLRAAIEYIGNQYRKNDRTEVFNSHISLCI